MPWPDLLLLPRTVIIHAQHDAKKAPETQPEICLDDVPTAPAAARPIDSGDSGGDVQAIVQRGDLTGVGSAIVLDRVHKRGSQRRTPMSKPLSLTLLEKAELKRVGRRLHQRIVGLTLMCGREYIADSEKRFRKRTRKRRRPCISQTTCTCEPHLRHHHQNWTEMRAAPGIGICLD